MRLIVLPNPQDSKVGLLKVINGLLVEEFFRLPRNRMGENFIRTRQL